MSNKYTSRSLSSVSRDEFSIETNSQKEPSWINDFISNLEKVGVKSRREDYALFEQINSAINNKSKYSSVDEAVADMRKRTGLDIYLKSTAQLTNQQQYKEPELFKTLPELKTFIDNRVEAMPGTTVEAVKDNIKHLALYSKIPNGDIPEDVQTYIMHRLTKEQKDIHTDNIADSMQLGKVDVNTETNVVDDPLASCMPNRDGK